MGNFNKTKAVTWIVKSILLIHYAMLLICFVAYASGSTRGVLFVYVWSYLAIEAVSGTYKVLATPFKAIKEKLDNKQIV